MSGSASSKRNRSFGGCATCRSRRLKCDEARPECKTCRRAGVMCGRYEAGLFFDSRHGQESQEKARFRRPLLSLRERARMSACLTATVPPHLAFWNLAQIEEQCADASWSEPDHLARGPFGVFKLFTNKPRRMSDDASNHDAGPEQIGFDGPSGTEASETAPYAPWLDTGGTGLNFGGDDIWNLGSLCDREQEAEAIIDVTTSNSLNEQHQTRNYFTESCVPRPPSPFAKSTSSVSQTACTLLKYYTSTILKSLTPFSHSKTPWHILFVPLVKTCLAGLALQEDLDEASLCVFYGTLTISSLSLGVTSRSQKWTNNASLYQLKSREHMLRALQSAYHSQKTAKYKSQVMALLTMVQISTALGNREETEFFLLEAERLIRIRGLNRAKSRKVRLLHHCYAYERIFFESVTHYYGRTANDRQHVRKAVESSGAMPYSQDSLFFRFRDSVNLESDMLRVKTREQGENDLHLEIAGLWPSTLYPEIFGVPETYILLVSMIIRLAREKDADERDDETNAQLCLRDFIARAKAIERCIKLQRRPPPSSDNEVDYLIEAVHQAITIYFYRRIYDVDISMLQKHVTDVRKAITNYELMTLDNGRGSIRLLWPAFIAASEAEDTESRQFFISWFKNAARQSGLQVFNASLENVVQTWDKQRSYDHLPLENICLSVGEDFFLEELLSGPP